MIRDVLDEQLKDNLLIGCSIDENGMVLANHLARLRRGENRSRNTYRRGRKNGQVNLSCSKPKT